MPDNPTKSTKKPRYQRRYRHRKKLRRFKQMVPHKYFFTRSQVFDVNFATLDETSPQGLFFNYSTDDGRQAVVAQYRFKLSDVTDWTEFSNLFYSYKIPAISMKIYPSCGIGGGSTRDNSQMIMYTMPADRVFTDIAAATHEEDFLVSQVCQKRLLLNNDTAKPVSFYMKLKQSFDIDDGQGRQAMIKPKWIPFTQGLNPQDVYHYGVMQRIQPINNSSLPNVQCKLVIKYYIACKQVR